MHFLKSFFKRITDDLKQKKLIPLKILFFVHVSTLTVLYPYLTIHMRELGIDVEETAIMSAVTPVISIVMPPLAGMLADKIGNFRLLLALSSALGGASALLLLAVPVGRITLTFPSEVDLLVSCDASALRLEHVREYPCVPKHPYAYDINLTVLSCGFVCDLPLGLSQEDTVHKNSYDVHLESLNSQRIVFRNTVSAPLTLKEKPLKEHSKSEVIESDPFFNSTASRVSDGQVFFPTPHLFDIFCTHDDNNATCTFGKVLNDFGENAKQMQYKVRVSHDAQKDNDVRSYWVNAVSFGNYSEHHQDFDGIDNTVCYDSFPQDNESEKVWVRVGPRRLTECTAACAAVVPRKALCDNQQQRIEIDPVFTFWTYLAVRVFIGIISGTSFAMFEGAVIAIVRDQRADYGLQRLYGSMGGMISSPLSGLMIDYASRGKGYTDFRPAFYLYAVLKVLSGVLMLSIDLEFKQPAQNLLTDVLHVFKNVELVALFTACFVMGTAWGYIESFLFWLLQDLGASRSLMGITITVGGVAGLPLLVLSGPIINRVGHANVIFVGFVFYAIRLLGYSLIYNPWLCLIFEALESVTSSLSFTAAVTYAARLSSTTTDTSVQGLLGGLYYGVGKGSGSLIGGYLMKFIGTRPTYQLFAGATLITGCIYYLFNKFYIGDRKMNDDNDICKKKHTDVEATNKTTKLEISPLDVASKIEPKSYDVSKNDAPENVDGGSDSGVDNPAFNDEESNRKKKDEEKAV
ncbi:uncharacterized protein LOC121730128 [Aricia agestis]|uniref:uncharacterized protein LOC121730128 n=1 Tax=Aricia agestis TaxID=91739 RepID=UPI001C20B248|nr:uncharacterized protein LOC121730128 [Aricia agestis]XP_041974939.1 uncharacterized protein LOC121730128 [Aricia agestis]